MTIAENNAAYWQWLRNPENQVISKWCSAMCNARLAADHADREMWLSVASRCEDAHKAMALARHMGSVVALEQRTISECMKAERELKRQRTLARQKRRKMQTETAKRPRAYVTSKRQDEIIKAVNGKGIEMPALRRQFSTACSTATLYRDVQHLRRVGLLEKQGETLKAKEQGANDNQYAGHH